MTSSKCLFTPIITFLCAVMFSACTVNYSFTGASIPIEAKTFLIKPFSNMAPTVNPQLAPLLSEKLNDQIMSATSLISARVDGDMQFEGTVVGYSISPVALQGGEVTVAAKNRLTITIKVKFQNRYEPKNDFETNFSQYEDFDSGVDLISVEQTLTEQIVEKLVTDIFNKAFVNW
ncbi:MAG TPA: LptE family protein [Salinivirgaceae bacterium]|nr:LptE family protein [Salinivirgaceae bacterium]